MLAVQKLQVWLLVLVLLVLVAAAGRNCRDMATDMLQLPDKHMGVRHIHRRSFPMAQALTLNLLEEGKT
jgi:hypothetical protein